MKTYNQGTQTPTYFTQTHSRWNATKIKTQVIFLALTMEEGKQTTPPPEVRDLGTLFMTNTLKHQQVTTVVSYEVEA